MGKGSNQINRKESPALDFNRFKRGAPLVYGMSALFLVGRLGSVRGITLLTQMYFPILH